MSLKGRVLFITGGSRGIGLEIGKRAAKDGAKVVLAAKTAEPHPKLPGTIYTAADEIIEAGGEALPLVLDVRDEKNVIDAIEQSASHFGGIDICVNNASAISYPCNPEEKLPINLIGSIFSIDGPAVTIAVLPRSFFSAKKRYPNAPT